MNLSPEQFASLKQTLSDPSAKISALLPSLDSLVTRSVLQRLWDLVCQHTESFGDGSLLCIYSPTQAGGTTLDSSRVTQLIKSETLQVKIGDSTNVVSANVGTASLMEASSESGKQSTFCVLCSSGKLVVFAREKLIAEIRTELHGPGENAKWHRSWKEMPLAMNEHFENCIQSEKQVRIWKNRRQRILLAGPDGTEMLFHQSLFWWFTHFLRDAIDVYGETNALGQDKTDITIVTVIGKIVIEVKWLGKNEKGSSFAEIRIGEGMYQVKNYLDRDGGLMKGYLVIYDARSRDKHENESDYPSDAKHDRAERPQIFFLRSETPSEFGLRMARESRNSESNS